MAFADETRVTEISIAADGRIYVFGASRQVIELLSDLQLGDPSLDRRAQHAGVQTGAQAVSLECGDLSSLFWPATRATAARYASEAELRDASVPTLELGNERHEGQGGTSDKGAVLRNPLAPMEMTDD
jgi:hypothetical protein